jgi:hypothetical protein
MTREEVRELEEVLAVYQRDPEGAFKKLLEIVVRKKLEVETQPIIQKMEKKIKKIKKEVGI